jgi:hypothetical protein
MNTPRRSVVESLRDGRTQRRGDSDVSWPMLDDTVKEAA